MPAAAPSPAVQPVGHLDQRDRIWAAIRRLRTFDWLQLSDATGGLNPAQTREYLQALRRGGYLTVTRRAGPRPGERAIWQLIRDTGVETPRLRRDGTPLPRTAYQRMWAALRTLSGTVEPEGLALSAQVPVVSAERYMRRLCRAGYLVCPAPRRYRLLPSRVTGPRAPATRRGGAIYDSNLGREITAADWAEITRRRP